MGESPRDMGARLKAEGVRFAFGAYVDVHGVPKSKCVPIDHFEDMALGSELYTFGALEGMGDLGPNEDECVAIPDLSGLTVLPWDRRYAIAPANLYLHGQPYAHDFRRLLQNQLDAAALIALQFTAGILAHADAVTAVLASTVNSYKRLLPRGLMNEISWAPVFRAYGHNNHTLMLGLPSNRRCVEVRVADGAANVHLATALTIAAGLGGIRRGLDPGEPVNDDTYKMSPSELEKAGITRLPSTLGESIEAFASSDFARETLGSAVHDSYVQLKRAEWLTYNTVVSDWERDTCLQLW